ncbi:MAG: hypothetical protein GC162_19605 [Planctomycetes bacterium]|nr:hypothetical protein [Planctomycetota bacterium]
MAITVEERYGRQLSGSSGEQVYLIQGAVDGGGDHDSAAARAALLAGSPTTFAGLVRDDESCRVEEIKSIAGAFEGFVSYTVNELEEVGSSSYDFDISGEALRITHSLSTTKYGTGAPDFKGAINVVDGKVDGVDIIQPKFSFSETHIIDDGDVDESYKNTIASLVGKVNAASFRGHAAGEVLFTGASGSKRKKKGDWEIKFSFAVSLTRTDIPIGDITVTTKDGWDYLWVYYVSDIDSTAHEPVQIPRSAYVEKVFYDADFSLLGI